jgi:hypothetical protein
MEHVHQRADRAIETVAASTTVPGAIALHSGGTLTHSLSAFDVVAIAPNPKGPGNQISMRGDIWYSSFATVGEIEIAIAAAKTIWHAADREHAAAKARAVARERIDAA